VDRLALYARAGAPHDGASQQPESHVSFAAEEFGTHSAPDLEALVAPKLSSALEEAFASQVVRCATSALDVCLADLQVISASPAGAAPDVSAIYPLLQSNGVGESPLSPSDDGRGSNDLKTRSSVNSATDRWAPSGWYKPDAQVDEIVSRVVSAWRAQFAQAVQRKVHSLFLLTLLDDLPSQLMRCIEGNTVQAQAGEEGASGRIDLSHARSDLSQRRDRLAAEQAQTQNLLRSFHGIKALYMSGKGLPSIGRPVGHSPR